MPTIAVFLSLGEALVSFDIAVWIFLKVSHLSSPGNELLEGCCILLSLGTVKLYLLILEIRYRSGR